MISPSEKKVRLQFIHWLKPVVFLEIFYNKFNKTSGKKENNILVAYFSHSGNTRVIANQIHESVGSDIIEIQSENIYPDNYNAVVKQAKQELDSDYKPKLKSKLKNINSYNIIFIGYPTWWYTIPMPVVTFLSEYDFSKKTIVPFCTHEGSGFAQGIKEIKKLCPQSTILNGLAVRGSNVKKAKNEVSEWLRELEMIE
ncbi:Flavodoxin [uncultured archaeon]|nr:Flavodoxin [uncultured archaeon]